MYSTGIVLLLYFNKCVGPRTEGPKRTLAASNTCCSLVSHFENTPYAGINNNHKSSPKYFRKSVSFSHNYVTKSPLVTMERPKFTPKLPFPLRRSPSPSNTPIPRPTPLTTPNSIRTQSAVLLQYTFRTKNRPTDRLTD